jgi:hypothetical protein
LKAKGSFLDKFRHGRFGHEVDLSPRVGSNALNSLLVPEPDRPYESPQGPADGIGIMEVERLDLKLPV